MRGVRMTCLSWRKSSYAPFYEVSCTPYLVYMWDRLMVGGRYGECLD
jgi:hypothetical protein